MQVFAPQGGLLSLLSHSPSGSAGGQRSTAEMSHTYAFDLDINVSIKDKSYFVLRHTLGICRFVFVYIEKRTLHEIWAFKTPCLGVAFLVYSI